MKITMCAKLLLLISFSLLAEPKGEGMAGFAVERQTTVKDIKERVEKKCQRLAKFTWSDYAALLDELKKDRYVVTTGKEFNATVDNKKIVVYMRHDIDIDPFDALVMAKMEKERNLRSSYYILPTAEYYGKQSNAGVSRYAAMDSIYKQLAAANHEIGVHNDLIGMMLQADVDPMLFQRKELEYYQSNGFDVVGVVSHGSGTVLKRKLNNMWIFSEFKHKGTFENNGKTYAYGERSFKDYGFQYEGYNLRFTQSAGDVGGRFRSSIKNSTGFVDFLQKCRPGDRVSLLTHPVWWGKAN